MRSTRLSIALTFILAAGMHVWGEDATPAANRTQQVVTAVAETNALLNRTAWKGLLFAAPTNSDAGVAALLKQEKRLKTGFLLRTEDPILYTRMQDVSQSRKGASVVLSGKLDPDRTNTILVTDLLELPKERKSERK